MHPHPPTPEAGTSPFCFKGTRAVARTISITVVLSLFGCSFFESTPLEPVDLHRALSENVEAPTPTQSPVAPIERFGVELTWRSTTKEIVGFVIYYGDSPSRLSFRRSIDLKEATLIEENNGSATYRYLLSGVEQFKPMFVAIAERTASGESPSSKALEVP